MLDSINKKQDPQFKQYSYRFVIVGLFSLASLTNGMCWVIVSPISLQIANGYGVQQWVVSLIPMLYMILYIFINFPSNWVLDEKGIRKGIMIGAITTALGSGIRCLVNVSFSFAIVGQLFCSIGQPFILNAPTKIASRWFNKKNRPLALAFLAVVNIVGTAIGFVVPSYFVPQINSKNNNPQTQSTIQAEFFSLCAFYFILTGITGLLVVFFFKQKPPKMPSMSAMVEPIQFKQSLKMLLKSKQFIFLTLAFATVNGTFNIYGSLVQPLLQPYGYSSDQISIFGAVMMVTGIVSAAIFGLYIEKTLNYHKMFIFCGVCGILLSLSFCLTMQFKSDSYWLFFVVFALQGMILIPLLPLSFDYGCQIMFPVGEAQITGALMTAGQILGIFFIIVSQQLLGLGSGNKKGALNTVIFVGVFLITGSLMFCFFNGKLKRAEIQKKQASIITSLTNTDHKMSI